MPSADDANTKPQENVGRNTTPSGGRSPMGPRLSLGSFGGSNAGSTRPMVGSGAPGNFGAPKGIGVRIGTRFAEGGSADMSQDKATIKKAFKQHDAQKHKGSKGTSLKLAKGGSTASKRADGCCSKGKTKGRFV